jgi:hypothetical protein
MTEPVLKDWQQHEALCKLCDLTEYYWIGGKQPVELFGNMSQAGPELVLPHLAQVEAWLAIKEEERPWPTVFAESQRDEEFETIKEYEFEQRWKKNQRKLWTQHAEMCVRVLKGKYQ